MTDYPILERKFILAKKIDETPEVLILEFRPDDGLPTHFEAGMFMMISGVDAAGTKHIARAFSIASDPVSPLMEFFVIKEPMHPKVVAAPATPVATATTPAAASATPAAAPAAPVMEPSPSHFVEAKIGDVFVMKGPSGQFRFDPTRDKRVLFIAGGTGLAPFMSMLRHIKKIASVNDVNLIYSVKFPTEIIRKSELQSYERDIGVKMTVTVTRQQAGDGWTGLTGHVNAAMIKQCASDYSDRMCYVCGPLAFVKAIKDAMTALGVDPKRVSADVWG